MAHLIFMATSEFSRSLHISSCWMLPAFSVEMRKVQFLSIDEVMAGPAEGKQLPNQTDE